MNVLTSHHQHGGVGDIMTTAVGSTSATLTSIPENSVRGEKKTIKSIIPRIFSSKRSYSRESFSEEEVPQSDGNSYENESDNSITSRTKAFLEESTFIKRGFSERHSTGGVETVTLPSFNQSMAPETVVQNLRVFVGTWNVGGNTPNHGMNLEDFLQVEGSADLYVLGFQEIVPLNAGNVLVIEDNEPASKWVALISHALNKPYHDSSTSSSSKTSKSCNNRNIFRKRCLKALSKNLRGNSDLLKACNCTINSPNSSRRIKLRDPCSDPYKYCDSSSDDSISMQADEISLMPPSQNYQLVASKQMVGLFLSVWARRELVKNIGHVRISCLGRGIMGYLGNKGCISISMTVHQTSFCFVCSHLASGEKEGDELRRNSDVAEILNGISFSRICKNSIPERIIDHERVIWLGDLNYRIGLSYEEARLLLEDNDWEALLEKDQLNTEREARRVFSGWKEGKILFAPTYKYSQNSDSYAGQNTKSKRKRRTPAWCDRILWFGEGVEQLSYIRGESRFSDHRPVCGVFAILVSSRTNQFRNPNSSCATNFNSLISATCMHTS